MSKSLDEFPVEIGTTKNGIVEKIWSPFAGAFVKYSIVYVTILMCAYSYGLIGQMVFNYGILSLILLTAIDLYFVGKMPDKYSVFPKESLFGKAYAVVRRKTNGKL